MDAPERKAQLAAWIAKSERSRAQVVKWSGLVAAIGLLVAIFVHGAVGGGLLMAAVAFGICGAWITTGHILTFKGQIKDLEAGRLAPQVIAVRQGRGRYQR